MYLRLCSFLTNYKVLFKRQFWFRNNQSTNPAVIILEEIIKKYLHYKCLVCGALIDLQI